LIQLIVTTNENSNIRQRQGYIAQTHIGGRAADALRLNRDNDPNFMNINEKNGRRIASGNDPAPDARAATLGQSTDFKTELSKFIDVARRMNTIPKI
jgi:hypothetical protein